MAQEIKYKEIGERFEIAGILVEVTVITTPSCCNRCIFDRKWAKTEGEHCCDYACQPHTRADGKDVWFKEI